VGNNAMRLAAQGVTMLCWADAFYPDGYAPENIRAAYVNAVKSEASAHYTAPIGNAELMGLIADKISKTTGRRIDPLENLIITPGSDAGLFFAMLPFIGHDDDVLVFTPSYPNNLMNPLLLGGNTVKVPLDEANGYQVNEEALEACVTPSAKMILMTDPNNPTTTVFTRESVESIARTALRHDLMVVVDYAFEDILFDGRAMQYISMLPNMFERTIAVHSMSKGYGLSGYRVGYIMADAPVIHVYQSIAVNVVGATNTAVQQAAIEAINDTGYIVALTRRFDNRRQAVCRMLGGVPGIRLYMPESSFLCWVDVSALGTSTVIAQYLIDEACVAVNDGISYGDDGRHLRIVYGCLDDDEALLAAIGRIRDALMRLARKQGYMPEEIAE
jgi:aspartate/methionine/tyrosine aminotransferase